MVAPYAGAWIETTVTTNGCTVSSVAPYAGAWIETCISTTVYSFLFFVAPYAGAWIETAPVIPTDPVRESRSLRGSVD